MTETRPPDTRRSNVASAASGEDVKEAQIYRCEKEELEKRKKKRSSPVEMMRADGVVRHEVMICECP